MAAIDPSAEAEEGGVAGSKPRATLKLIREAFIPGLDDYDDESDFDEDEMNALLAEEDEDDEDEDESEDEAGAGPSDPAKSKKARKAAAADQLRKALTDEMELDIPNGATKKGKGKLANGTAEVEEEDSEEDSEDDEDFDDVDDPEEFVICTLDPEKVSRNPYKHSPDLY